MELLDELIIQARQGDLEAYGRVVRTTQGRAYAIAKGVLRDPALAEDATQEAFLRAFRRLGELDDPAAFAAWLRRIVVTVALNLRRTHRRTLLCLGDVPDIPVLDEAETNWTEYQRARLASALLALTPEERRLCDRRYHGAWTIPRLAREAGIDEAAMRKRLQRIRDKLRKEIEVAEQRAIGPDEIRRDLPGRVVELLARPQLTELPENPVGSVADVLRTVYRDFNEIVVPEIVDFAEASKTIGDEALYLDPGELHRVDERRILRYDLTLPMLLTARFGSGASPLRAWAAGKVYRRCPTDATHLEAFHQAEVLCVDSREHLDQWRMTSLVLKSADALFPGRQMKLVPTNFPMCTQAWELEIEWDGRWFEVIAWGVFTDRLVRHIGADPAVHTAIGVGHGLERLAMLKYGIDDIRKVEAARVA